jgi:hypothetical protein
MATIYKLTDEVSGICYIGSTVTSLARRIATHKCNFKKWKVNNHFPYYTAYQIFENGSYQVLELEKTDLEHRYERERYYLENTENCINKYKPGRSSLEYYYDNRDKIIKRVLERYHEKKKQEKNKKTIVEHLTILAIQPTPNEYKNLI